MDFLIFIPIVLGYLTIPYLSKLATSLCAQKYGHHIIIDQAELATIKPLKRPTTRQLIIYLTLFLIGVGLGLYDFKAKFFEPEILILFFVGFLSCILLMVLGELLGRIAVYYYVIKHPNSLHGFTHIKGPIIQIITISIMAITCLPIIIVTAPFVQSPCIAGVFAAALCLLLQQTVKAYTKIKHQQSC